MVTSDVEDADNADDSDCFEYDANDTVEENVPIYFRFVHNDIDSSELVALDDLEFFDGDGDLEDDNSEVEELNNDDNDIDEDDYDDDNEDEDDNGEEDEDDDDDSDIFEDIEDTEEIDEGDSEEQNDEDVNDDQLSNDDGSLHTLVEEFLYNPVHTDNNEHDFIDLNFHDIYNASNRASTVGNFGPILELDETGVVIAPEVKPLICKVCNSEIIEIVDGTTSAFCGCQNTAGSNEISSECKKINEQLDVDSNDGDLENNATTDENKLVECKNDNQNEERIEIKNDSGKRDVQLLVKIKTELVEDGIVSNNSMIAEETLIGCKNDGQNVNEHSVETKIDNGEFSTQQLLEIKLKNDHEEQKHDVYTLSDREIVNRMMPIAIPGLIKISPTYFHLFPKNVTPCKESYYYEYTPLHNFSILHPAIFNSLKYLAENPANCRISFTDVIPRNNGFSLPPFFRVNDEPESMRPLQQICVLEIVNALGKGWAMFKIKDENTDSAGFDDKTFGNLESKSKCISKGIAKVKHTINNNSSECDNQSVMKICENFLKRKILQIDEYNDAKHAKLDLNNLSRNFYPIASHWSSANSIEDNICRYYTNNKLLKDVFGDDAAVHASGRSSDDVSNKSD